MPGERPLFIPTMGERKAMENEGSFSGIDRLMHYREVAACRYDWTVPDGVPPRYPEYAIYDCGGLGRADYAGSAVPIAGRASLYGALGEPLKWMPAAAGTYSDPGLLRERPVSEDPFFLVDRIPMSEKLRPLCDLQASAWDCLAITVEAMKQPIVIEASAGGELRAMRTEEGLKRSYRYLKTLDRGSIDARVLDTGGHDHSQNLIATAGAIDSEILSILGIPALGTVKTSGVSEAEAGAMAVEMRMIIREGLRARQALIGRIDPDGAMGLSVRINPDLAISDASERDDETNRTPAEKRKARRERAASAEVLRCNASLRRSRSSMVTGPTSSSRSSAMTLTAP